MNFSEALKAMKMGSKVSREVWRGRISYWYIPKGKDVFMQVLPDDSEKQIESISMISFFAEDWWIVT